MPLGDSLTYGVAQTSVQGGYRNRLYTALTAAGFNVDFVGNLSDTSNLSLPDVNHEGHPAYRIDQIQANIGEWLKSVEDPDVILLLIGTNDVWQDLDLAEAPARLSGLIADIATVRPFAKIIVSNLPPRIDSNAYEAKQVTFNDTIPGIVAQQVALGRQVTFLDMHSVLNTDISDYSTDGVHPSSSGYVKMANAWASKVAEVITPTGTANPPVIAKTGPQVDLTHIPVVFSKPVADGAVDLSNFSLSGGLTVSNAVLDATTKRTVTLTTSTQTPGLVYSVSVSNVHDRTPQQNRIAPQSMANFSPGAVTNGSFENDDDGWTVTGNLEIQSGSPYTATDGSKIVAFNTGDSPPGGTLSQTFATTVGQTYQLTFDYGLYAFNTPSQQRLQVAVLGGSQELVTDMVTINRNGGGGGVVWSSETYDFTAVTTETTLTFTDASAVSASLDLLLDHVRVGALATRYLSVTSSATRGAGMTISPDDTSGSGDGEAGLIRSYNEGASVTVTAAPTHEGGDFLRWRKNGVDLAGSVPAITVTMNANHALTAIYESNNPPVAVSDGFSTDEDTPLQVEPSGVLGNDTDDGPVLTAVLVEDVQHGELTLRPDGGFTYVPDADFNGVDSFSYKVSDGTLDSNIVTVMITVHPLEEFAQWLDENNPAAGPGDDPDGDSLSNAVEYVVGGNPVDSSDAQLNPTVEPVSADLDGSPGAEDYLLFRYRRTDRAHADPSTAIKVEWGADPAGPWSDAEQTPGVFVDEEPAGAGAMWVKVYLPKLLGVDGRFFARLNVVIQSAP